MVCEIRHFPRSELRLACQRGPGFPGLARGSTATQYCGMRSRLLDRRGIARTACALAVQTALMASPACGGSGGTGPSPPSSSYTEYSSAHFLFRHTSLDTATIAQTAATVESSVARITASLG